MSLTVARLHPLLGAEISGIDIRRRIENSELAEFIQAMDEAHARRIVERNGSTWTRSDDKVKMVVESIENTEKN